MKPPDTLVDPDNAYAAREYWTRMAEGQSSADASGLAPVLHPDVPPWFNQLIDKLQLRAMHRALEIAVCPPGARVLDVGCGTGRWVRRYQGIKLDPIGVDATPSMLRLAADRGTTAPLVAGEAGRLPFSDTAFDLVSDITVTQHIPSALQPEAIGEMVRVLKPGGRLILMELIRGEGAHIFPRAPLDWIALAKSRGLGLLEWFGQEYLLIDRLLVHAVQAVAPRNRSSDTVSKVLGATPSGRSPVSRRAFWSLRHIAASFSVWTEPLAEAICPGRIATHGVFIFRK
jgi:SAM-dependent methyltransferase